MKQCTAASSNDSHYSNAKEPRKRGVTICQKRVQPWLMRAALLVICCYGAILITKFRNIDEEGPARFGDLIQEMGSELSGLRVAPCDHATLCLAVVHLGGNHPMLGTTAWSPPHQYDEAVYTLADASQRLGGSSCVRDISFPKGRDLSQCGTAKHILLFGSHLLDTPSYPSTFKIPSEVIIYNTKLVENVPVSSSFIHLLKTHQVWDRSVSNVEHLKLIKSSGGTPSHHACRHVPLGYAKGLTYVPPPPPKKKKKHLKKDHNGKKIKSKPSDIVPDIDVLFIGTCSTRRSAILRALIKLGFNVRISTSSGQKACSSVSKETIPPVYGLAKVQLLKRSKILLKVYAYNTGDIDSDLDDITFYLANSIFVISEQVGNELNDAESAINGGVVFAHYETLINACVEYLDNGQASGYDMKVNVNISESASKVGGKGEQARRKVAEKGLQLVTQLDNTPHLRCPLFGSRQIVNSGIDVYTSQPFPPVAAAPFDISTAQLEAFMKEFTPPSCFRVVAIMAGYNQGDTLSSSITDLISQGIHVHFIDNWSTDNTHLILKKLQLLYPRKVSTELYPIAKSTKTTTATAGSLLERKSQLARDDFQKEYDWVVFVNANELMDSPWGAQVSLRRALYVADQLDYNLINFGKRLVFHPDVTTIDTSTQNVLKKLRTSHFHFSMSKGSKGNSIGSVSINAWKTYFSSCHEQDPLAEKVIAELTSVASTSTSNAVGVGTGDSVNGRGSGGLVENDSLMVQFLTSPEAFFPGHRLFPFPFFLRQYPSSLSAIREDDLLSVSSIFPNAPDPDTTTRDQNHGEYKEMMHGRVYDNGDIPAALLSAFLPCRDSGLLA